jgi:hypothetical protein
MMHCLVFAGVLLGVLAFKAHRFHRMRWHAYHHGCGPEPGCGPGAHACGHPRGRWRGFRGPLYVLFERLDLTPAQEKVVRAEVDRLRERARALRGDSLDETALADMFVRHDDRLRELREELGGALGRIHLALDERQRERLADLVERGFGRGPYR